MTPYALIFANERFESEVFPAIAAEAESRGIDLSDPDAFVLLANVGTLLRDFTEPLTDLGPLAALLFQAYHFWRFDRRVYTLDDAQLEALLTRASEIGSWQLAPPHPAAYLQLPRHRLWSRIEDGATAEAVDGFFWTMIGHPDAAAQPYVRLDVLLALGMHTGRPGLSVIDVSITLPGEPAGHWADVRAREEGDDFANVLPGGELSGLHALVNSAEVLKLVSRVFFDLCHDASAAGLAPDG